MVGINLFPRRVDLPVGPGTLFFSEGTVAKVAGYNTGPYATNTGTSAAGVLCATDGLGPCSGVLLGGEPPGAGDTSHAEGSSGIPEPKAKVRVFHVYNFNHQAPQQVSDAIGKLWSEGLVVKAALGGGLRGDELSRNMVGALKEVLRAHDVPVVHDTTLSREQCGGDTLLGGIVNANRVLFTDDARVVPTQLLIDEWLCADAELLPHVQVDPAVVPEEMKPARFLD